MRIKGHDSFSLRKGWLHKGVRNILANENVFNATNVCDILGLGPNMVKALRFWLQASGIAENQRGAWQLTPLGDVINRNDQYYEETGTNYIVHYKIATNVAQTTAWYWFFNEYQGRTIDRQQFSAEDGEFVSYLKAEGYPSTPSVKNLEDELACLVRTYYNRLEKDDNPEETKICPLSELGLLALSDDVSKEYRKTSPEKEDLHPMIAYAVIMDNLNERVEIPIDTLRTEKCNIGRVFNLDRTVLIQLLEKLEKMGLIAVSQTAGLDVIRILTPMSFIECVESYYVRLMEEGV
jgi:hypothetical protein